MGDGTVNHPTTQPDLTQPTTQPGLPTREKFVPNASYLTFLTCLRLARQARGVSQRELARRLGVHHSRVHRAEDAKRALDLPEVRAWCGALGLSLVEFTRDLDAALERGAATTIAGADATPIPPTGE